MYKSRVNQPERVFINSSDDATNTATEPGFNIFTATFDTPILDAKKTQLLRATIPNAQVNIPDYCLVFYYYNLPTATTVPSLTYLKAVRLYPSTWTPPTAYLTYVKNRYFSDPADFVTQLNLASSAGGDLITYNPIWQANDVLFAYNATTKQITMTGQTAGRYYAIAGWDDPIVNAYQASNNIVVPNFTGAGTTPQAQLVNYTLNLRVGYTYSGTAWAKNNQSNTGSNIAYANLTQTAFANAVGVPPDSFPNLVYSQCVYLYANVVAGSSLGSGKQHNLLSVIPSNAPQLGVIQYTALTINFMTRIPDNIYAIQIEMRDDANQPFVLPDSAQVNVELAFLYTE